MTAIAFENVALSLGGRRILSDVGFAVAEGDFVGILGPNGSGKTTLLRAILGLVTPESGRIEVLGRPPRHGNPAAGYMPQIRQPVGDVRLSGEAFVLSAVGGHRWGLPLPNREERREAARVLELVGATDLAKRPIHELSGGERQRLLLAQAFLGRPPLLLLDEPLLSLDPPHQAEVVRLIRRIQKDLGVTVLFSAHELNPLLGALDKVLYLGNGQAALGTVDEVITGPVLSRLYGMEVEVVRLDGRIFVMADSHDMERVEHRHDV